MKKIFGNVVSDDYFEKFINDESNKNLVIVGDEIIGIQHILTKAEQIEELTNWFNTTYRYKDEKYNRLIVLNKLDDDGISPTIKRNELYEEAENVRLEIQRLEEELKNGN